MIAGAFFFACSKRSLTLEAPTPTNISTKSEPEIEKNGTFASPATALARSVLPVPGGPRSRTPLGILAPISVYFLLSRRKSTISLSSSFSSSAPATSSKVAFLLLGAILAFVFPKDDIFPPPAFFIMNTKKNIITPSISSVGIRLSQKLLSDIGIRLYCKGSSGFSVLYFLR